MSHPTPSNHSIQNDRQPSSDQCTATCMRMVATTFDARPDIRDGFVSMMIEFKANRIDRDTMVERVSTLFKDYPSLKQGFLACVPPQYRANAGHGRTHSFSSTTSSTASTSATVEVEDEETRVDRPSKRMAHDEEDHPSGSRSHKRPRLDSSPPSSTTSALRPRSINIGHLISSVSPHPFNNAGRLYDLFVGVHVTEGHVALKRIRLGLTNYSDDITKVFLEEAKSWLSLDHKHLLKFLGICYVGGVLHLVAPFVKNGPAPQYLKAHPGADRLRLLHQTAEALAFLHKRGIIHGDIKGANVLVSDGGEAFICDFGLSRYDDYRVGGAIKGACSLRWEAPELWKRGARTLASDVYAFGMLIVELLTDNLPFANYAQASAIIAAVDMRGERPAMEPMFSQTGTTYYPAWSAARHCWHREPEKRLSMPAVALLLLPRAKIKEEDTVSSGGMFTTNGDAMCFPRCPAAGPTVTCIKKTCERRRYHLRCVGLLSSPGRRWTCLDCEERQERKRHASSLIPQQSFSFMIHPQAPTSATMLLAPKWLPDHSAPTRQPWYRGLLEYPTPDVGSPED